jgi:peroxiredoxin
MEINNKGLYIYENDDFLEYKLNDDKVILCGVPGAFTPGCTHKHLAGFVKNIDKFNKYKVVFVAVNDPCVMDEWNKIYGHESIEAVADPLAVFVTQLGYNHDYGDSMGIRCHRFAVLIEDGILTKTFKSPFAEGVLAELLP